MRKESNVYIEGPEQGMTVEERLKETLDVYRHEGEGFHLFGYHYREEDQIYYAAYFFPRKKGAAHLSGFVVLDQEGQVISREKAVAINEAFNRYNLLFKRFQNEWGDVVEQDLRKYERALPHFEALTPLVDDNHPLKSVLAQGEETVRQVLQYQERFLQLDLEAIQLGKKRRQTGCIDSTIDEKVKVIMEQFEETLFSQYEVQANCLSAIAQLDHFLQQERPPREWKKHLKKIMRLFKRMKKLVAASEERLAERRKDPLNKAYYQRHYAEWEAKVRN